MAAVTSRANEQFPEQLWNQRTNLNVGKTERNTRYIQKFSLKYKNKTEKNKNKNIFRLNNLEIIWR